MNIKSKKTGNTIILTILLILTVLWAAFIWSNSLQTGLQSTGTSDKIASFLSENLNLNISTFLIRKAGHVLEFSILGILLCLCIKIFGNLSSRFNDSYVFFSGILFGFLVACIDEAIQLKVEGRNGCFTDVLIDTFSVVFICLVFYIVHLIEYFALRKKEKF